MGGNALAPFGARRYDRAEYLEISNRVLNMLWLTVPEEIAIEIPSYHKKESFGDMDIIVQGPWDKADYDAVIDSFSLVNRLKDKPSHHVKNGDVMSILFEELQVDIIPMPEEDLNTAHMYYSYNDLGNLMGKLYHKFGLKYGHRGLTYPMRDGDNQYDEIMVSKDGAEIFSFLGLDYQQFCRGFNTLEDIFKFVMSSKYFSPEPYQYENLNHANRIRDKKRTTYHGFLEYIKANVKPEPYFFHPEKDVYFTPIRMHFPSFGEKYFASLEKLEHRLKVKAHFNGELVTELTGHTGLRLGKLMAQIKHNYGEPAKWVLSLSKEHLKSLIMWECEKFDKFERMSTLDFPNLETRLAILEARKKSYEYQTIETNSGTA